MEAPQRGPDPGDEALIANMIKFGCDPREAGVWRDHVKQGTYGQRVLRYSALNFYWDTRAMARGNAAARDRVDFVRSAWEAMRQAQLERAKEEAPSVL